MASPQKENGFTPIANELFEAFYRCKLLEYERCLIMCIWRKTYGWKKKEDWVSHSQIMEETGISLPNIARTIKSLISKKMLLKEGRQVAVNKNYEEWVVKWRRLSHQTTQVVSPDNKRLSHQSTTKERKKITKERGEAKASANRVSSLLNNKKDMGWNNKSDDFEEGVVNLDEGLDLVAEKKKPTKKYPNAPAIRKIFQEVLGKNPAIWKLNSNQLQACENLYKERTPEKVKIALEFYNEHKDEKYCPIISSPYDLDSKWTKLGEFKLRL